MKINVSNDVLVAARNRGYTYEQLGRVLGVSFQAIQQRIGHDGNRFRNAYNLGGLIRCLQCKKIFSLKSREPGGIKYCSNTCFNLHSREMNDCNTIRAINMRIEGETWKDVSKKLGWTYQAIQYSIWRLLNQKDFLSWDVIYNIWRCVPTIQRKTFGVNHLINNTGLSPVPGKKYPEFSNWLQKQ